MTKEDILVDHELYLKYEGMGQKEDLMQAMDAYAKYHASLAWDAGLKAIIRSDDLYKAKEEFLNQTFNQ